MNNSPSKPLNTGASRIEKEDAELYDRQIRLFGAESQQRLFSSNVLIVGYDDSIAELLKDLLLAGVRSLHLMYFSDIPDDNGTLASTNDTSNENGKIDMLLALGGANAAETANLSGIDSNGMQSRAEAICQAAQSFNRTATLQFTASYEDAVKKLSSVAFLKHFEVVVVSLQASQLKLHQITGVAELCREAGTGIIVTVTSAFYGFFLCDYGDKFYFTRKLEDLAGEESEKKDAAKSSRSTGASGSLKLPESLLRYPPLHELLMCFCTRPLNEFIQSTLATGTTAPPKKRSRVLGREVGKLTAYALLQAVLHFYDQHTRLPRSVGAKDDLELLEAFQNDLQAILQGLGVMQRTKVVDDEEELRQLQLLVRNFSSRDAPEYFWVQTLMGAELSQEVLTVLMRDSAPTRNIFFFDGAYEQVDFGKSAHIGAPGIRTTHEAPAIQLFVPLRAEFEASSATDAASTAGTVGDDEAENDGIHTIEDEEEELKDELRRKQQSTHPVVLLETD